MEKYISKIFAVLTAVAVALAILLCLKGMNSSPKLLGASEAAERKTETLMEGICQQDLERVRQVMLEQRQLEDPYEFTHGYSEALWEAYAGSLSYTFDGGCYPSEDGLARNVTVTVLDLPAVIPYLAERCQRAWEEQPEDTQAKLKEDSDYRETFLADVAHTALDEVKNDKGFYTSRDLTLGLVLEDGQWWILPNEAIFALLSGETV